MCVARPLRIKNGNGSKRYPGHEFSDGHILGFDHILCPSTFLHTIKLHTHNDHNHRISRRIYKVVFKLPLFFGRITTSKSVSLSRRVISNDEIIHYSVEEFYRKGRNFAA